MVVRRILLASRRKGAGYPEPATPAAPLYRTGRRGGGSGTNEPIQDAEERLSEYLRERDLLLVLDKRDLLLVLDNCEPVVSACAELAVTLLAWCPSVRIMTTSREALDVTGERVWRPDPLGGDDADPLARQSACIASACYLTSVADWHAPALDLDALRG